MTGRRHMLGDADGHHGSDRDEGAMPQTFGESAVIRRVAGEALLIAGGGRATVLQNAHPLIAKGTAEHSGFAARPLSRLHNTLTYMYAVIFGTEAEAQRISHAVASMHRRVAGPGYSADNPALQVWVAATLYDTATILYESVFGPLPAADADACYQQYSVLATALGCPRSEWPASRPEFSQYWEYMITGLRPDDTSRAIGHALLFPANLPLTLRPALPVNRLITIGLLPAPIRERLGYSWTRRQDRLLRHGLQFTARLYPHLPDVLRQAPKTRYLRSLRKRTTPTKP
jgi:uncharacterized protein (DUF2236 family)